MGENTHYIFKVGSRGELYISKEVREMLGIRDGGYVYVVVDGNRLVIKPLNIEDRIW